MVGEFGGSSSPAHPLIFHDVGINEFQNEFRDGFSGHILGWLVILWQLLAEGGQYFGHGVAEAGWPCLNKNIERFNGEKELEQAHLHAGQHNGNDFVAVVALAGCFLGDAYLFLHPGGTERVDAE